MDYETLIENLVFWSKAFHVNPQARDALEKAATAITDLLVENQSLRNAANGFKARAEAAEARAEKAERERDEAVSDLETIMVFGDSGLDTCDFCKNNQCYARSGNNPCLPKWRGRKED